MANTNSFWFNSNYYGGNRPNYEIEKLGEDVLIHVEVPGYKKDEIDLEVESGVLTVSGKRTYLFEGEEKTKSFKQKFWGDFSKYGELSANLENGILKITIPKVTKREKIKINLS
jgi:HSP20 family protein